MIITVVNGKLLIATDGDIGVWVETAHDTRQVETKVVTREEFDALLSGKMPEIIV